jgi:putative endonuclease
MKAEQHFIYMLRCKGDRIYTGYTTDVEARYQKHCEGTAAHFTKAFPPMELLCSVPVPSRSLGLKLEAAFKRLARVQKSMVIAEIRNGNTDNLRKLIDF